MLFLLCLCVRREQAEERRSLGELDGQDEADGDADAVHRPHRARSALEDDGAESARTLWVVRRGVDGAGEEGSEVRPVEGLRVHSVRRLRRADASTSPAAFDRRAVVRGEGAQFEGGDDPAGAMQGVRWTVHWGLDRGRPAGILQQVRRGDGRLHPEALPRLQLRHLPRSGRGAESVRRGSHHQGGVGARIKCCAQVWVESECEL